MANIDTILAKDLQNSALDTSEEMSPSETVTVTDLDGTETPSVSAIIFEEDIENESIDGTQSDISRRRVFMMTDTVDPQIDWRMTLPDGEYKVTGIVSRSNGTVLLDVLKQTPKRRNSDDYRMGY